MTSTDLCAASYHANEVSRNAHAAYWLRGSDNKTSEFLVGEVADQFHKLADALGYDVTKRELMEGEQSE